MRFFAMVIAAVWVSAAGWGGAAVCRAADVVVLRSGTMMEGEVVSLDGGELVLEIESGRSILDRGDIRSVHFDTTAEALREWMKRGREEGERKGEKEEGVKKEEAPAREEGERKGEKEEGVKKEEKAPGEEEDGGGRVFRLGDKRSFSIGDVVQTGAVQVGLMGASIERVKYQDLFGSEKESRGEFLAVRFRAANVGDLRVLEVKGDPVFGEAYVRAEDGEGDRVERKSFGTGTRVVGELRDGTEIDPGESVTHVEVFERPGEGVEEIVVRVNLAKFGEGGVVKWRFGVGEIGEGEGD